MKNFVAIVDYKGFSQAAKHIYVSAPNLSKQVRFLEAWLGGELLDRSTRKMRLTPLGEAFYPRCQSILSDVEKTKQVANDLSGKPSGRIQILSTVRFGHQMLFPKVQAFMRLYPEVSCYLKTKTSSQVILESQTDIIISAAAAYDSELERKELCRLKRCIVASPTYLKKHGTPQKPSDLQNHQCILNLNRIDLGCWKISNETTIKVNGDFAADNGDIMTDAACAGMGLLLSSEYAVDSYIKSGALKRVLESYVDYETPFYAYYKTVPTNKLLLTTFLDYLTSASFY